MYRTEKKKFLSWSVLSFFHKKHTKHVYNCTKASFWTAACSFLVDVWHFQLGYKFLTYVKNRGRKIIIIAAPVFLWKANKKRKRYPRTNRQTEDCVGNICFQKSLKPKTVDKKCLCMYCNLLNPKLAQKNNYWTDFIQICTKPAQVVILKINFIFGLICPKVFISVNFLTGRCIPSIYA